jgi:hypothetical protein
MKSIIQSLCLLAIAMLISIPSFAYIVASPSYVSFGTVKVGGFSGGWRTISIQNQSQKPTNIDVSPMCPMEFRVTNMCYGQLQAYGSCSVSIDYHPTRPGYHSCTISVRDYQGGYQTVSVSGSAQL